MMKNEFISFCKALNLVNWLISNPEDIELDLRSDAHYKYYSGMAQRSPRHKRTRGVLLACLCMCDLALQERPGSRFIHPCTYALTTIIYTVFMIEHA